MNKEMSLDVALDIIGTLRMMKMQGRPLPIRYKTMFSYINFLETV